MNWREVEADVLHLVAGATEENVRAFGEETVDAKDVDGSGAAADRRPRPPAW